MNLKSIIVVFLFLLGLTGASAKKSLLKYSGEIDNIRDQDVYRGLSFKGDILYGLQYIANPPKGKKNYSRVVTLNLKDKKRETVVPEINGLASAFLVRDQNILVYYWDKDDEEKYYLSSFDFEGNETILLEVGSEASRDSIARIIQVNETILLLDQGSSYDSFPENTLAEDFLVENKGFSRFVFVGNHICHRKIYVNTDRIGDTLFSCLNLETNNLDIDYKQETEDEDVVSAFASNDDKKVCFAKRSPRDGGEASVFCYDLEAEVLQPELLYTMNAEKLSGADTIWVNDRLVDIRWSRINIVDLSTVDYESETKIIKSFKGKYLKRDDAEYSINEAGDRVVFGVSSEKNGVKVIKAIRWLVYKIR